MLLILLALHVAGATPQRASAPVVHPHPPVRVRTVRSRLPQHAATLTALRPLLTACDLARDCGRTDPAARYRVAASADRIVDPRLEMVRPTGPACGLTGMPVCPGHGRRVLHVAY